MKPTLNKIEFDKLSTMEQRVAICKDVLARIKIWNIVPKRGNFINDNCDQGNIAQGNETLQEFFNSKECHACAKGAVIISWIGNFNKYNDINGLDFNLDFKQYPKELIKIFGRKLLDTMEVLFEGKVYAWTSQSVRKVINNYYGEEWISKWPLEDIMNNIIQNKGKLKLH